MKRTRDPFWDIVKGIAILLVIYGHTGAPGAHLVTMFHLEVFFLATGYFFREERDGADPFGYFARRLSRTWGRYVLYAIVFVLVHNLIVAYGLLAYAGDLYSPRQLLDALMMSMLFECPEMISIPLWFVPAWLLGSGAFAALVWLSRWAAEACREECAKALLPATLIIISVMAAAIGQVYVHQPEQLLFRVDVVPVILPFFTLGFLLRKWEEHNETVAVSSWPAWLQALVAAACFGILVFLRSHGVTMDLKGSDLPGLWLYPIACTGVLMVLCLAGLIRRVPVRVRESAHEPVCESVPVHEPVPVKVLGFLGRQSFDLMAMHLPVFLVLDLLLTAIRTRGLPAEPLLYPSSRTAAWGWAYMVVGAAISAAVGVGIDQVKKILWK